MKRTAAVLASAAILAAAIAGCGGSQETSTADEQAVRDLVAQLNKATVDRDAEAACDVIAPSSMKETFQTRSRCVRETGAIMKNAGKQEPVTVDSVSVDGDRATVTFEGRNFDQEVVREDGRWYIPISGGAPPPEAEQ